MSGRVWVISCACGWSRMVPRSTPADRRRRILDTHHHDTHRRTNEGNSDVQAP